MQFLWLDYEVRKIEYKIILRRRVYHSGPDQMLKAHFVMPWMVNLRAWIYSVSNAAFVIFLPPEPLPFPASQGSAN